MNQREAEIKEEIVDSSDPFCCTACSLCCDSFEELHQHIKEDHHEESKASTEQKVVTPSQTQTSESGYFLRTLPRSSITEVQIKRKKKRFINATYATIRHILSVVLKGMSARIPEKKPYECTVCQRTFSEPSKLKKHIRIHTGEKPYECDFCKRKFTQMSHLKSHIYTHTGEKPYDCRFCERKFSEVGSRKKHERTHTGEKPYECKFCDGKFSRFDTLKMHERKHTKEKPYKCYVCNSRFARADGLMMHGRTHTGEKRFQCNLCDRKFIKLALLKKHELTHSVEQPVNVKT